MLRGCPYGTRPVSNSKCSRFKPHSLEETPIENVCIRKQCLPFFNLASDIMYQSDTFSRTKETLYLYKGNKTLL